MNWIKLRITSSLRRTATLGAAVVLSALFAGCPVPPTGDTEYDAAFLIGFAQDDYYWQGFYDSYDTVDGGPIYYAGADIPYYESPAYDAGYWDGVWYAYNDGYFVDYDYAFTIGFSEGYDIAFGPGGVDFIQDDEHIEWLDGGFSDGYNDGFSEGRVFGAYDYEAGLAFDWFDAMLDYRDGTDLTIGGVSTGNAGPVDLYIYGTDPNDLFAKAAPKDGPAKRAAAGFTIRKGNGTAKTKAADDTELSYRPLPADTQAELNVRPAASPRDPKKLTLTTTWLDRVNQYRNALDAKTAPKAARTQ